MARRADRFTRIAICLCLIRPMACDLPAPDYTVAPPGGTRSPRDYKVLEPGRTRTPYDKVLEAYTPHGDGWIELKLGMGLFIQHALLREGSTDHRLENYLGTESVRYEVDDRGRLREFGEVSRIEPRPQPAPPVDQLISKRQQEKRYHRFFNHVLIPTPKTPVRPPETLTMFSVGRFLVQRFLQRKDWEQAHTYRVATLISSDSPEKLQALTEKLQSGVTAMEDVSADNYTLLPENASAAVEFSFTVDGSPTRAVWGKRLSGVVGDSHRPKLFRLYKGEWRRVDFDPEDRQSLNLPLLPGDRVELK